MKENGRIVRCPKCNSTDVTAVENFDYVKMCMNNRCIYKLLNAKTTKWRYQFSTGVHN